MTVDKSVLDELAALSDGTSWQRADRLLELFPTNEWGDAEDNTNTGLHEQLSEYEDELRNKRGIEWKMQSMRDSRSTAIKWPDVTRVTSTSFRVHKSLRGENRYAEMQKYLRMAEKEGVALTATRLGRYRADEKGVKPLDPIDERWTKKLDSTTKRFLVGAVEIDRDDWWRSQSVSQESLAIVREIGIQYFKGLT